MNVCVGKKDQLSGFSPDKPPYLLPSFLPPAKRYPPTMQYTMQCNRVVQHSWILPQLRLVSSAIIHSIPCRLSSLGHSFLPGTYIQCHRIAAAMETTNMSAVPAAFQHSFKSTATAVTTTTTPTTLPGHPSISPSQHRSEPSEMKTIQTSNWESRRLSECCPSVFLSFFPPIHHDNHSLQKIGHRGNQGSRQPSVSIVPTIPPPPPPRINQSINQ